MSFVSHKSALYGAPLCPAGHLPHLGGDWLSQPPSPIYDVAGMSGAPKLPISPLVGEMSGRTEGGAVGYLPPHRSGN
ncbi:hypothetical protein FJ959_15305 [Mesorhizobium sp. B2-2-4]|nr:hypothetical protein FJ867_15855 [Mesorhizobium sp. B2-5-3]TPL10649.1 hypothetical protein FJ944_13020 [Mesorhizobium sp. B2-4-11]TPL21798.1 hypothetical protein FJ952_06915 [Mesorhizobium sp. B2-4-10]TPL56914.1 hypothetical protein FJ937_01860 [Mesorhizobium sp. B2-4-4]TPM56594.1 hypothetical protein FJ959_15305 [Mesorhizobium sp. B2-2-4]TPM68649.1 hypothetical protein FJ965_08545 [Mesorhizobium sp. B2-2-1]TPN67518.1 hypothetical protein FJ986_11260 [Mesorhizobium sp. B1-1-1]TPN71666.1 h